MIIGTFFINVNLYLRKGNFKNRNSIFLLIYFLQKYNMQGMDAETEERFIALETKLAYMEDFVEKLQTETVEQSRQIEILRKENQILADRYKELLENADVPNRRPPHY